VLRQLLERKIAEHSGMASAMAADPEVARALGYERGWMPHSTLRARLSQLGLEPLLEQERKRQRQELGREAPALEELVAAVRRHRSGTLAARALGISRDVLVWNLRKAGISVRTILGQAPEPQG
jgi:hypothetical protein